MEHVTDAPRSFFQSIVAVNRALSQRLDAALLSEQDRRFGTTDFHARLIPAVIRPGMTVYDVGGGKTTVITAEQKAALGITLTGIDYDPRELADAPPGIFDTTRVADITRDQPVMGADLVISRSTLEHVCDSAAALAYMAGCLRPGGLLVIFAPCRYAGFALLNRLLPEGVKRRLLTVFYPAQAHKMGFPAYYDRCTPRGISAIGRTLGLMEQRRVLYWHSTYFTACFPVHLIWRLYQILIRACGWSDGCEGMAFVWKKPEGS